MMSLGNNYNGPGLSPNWATFQVIWTQMLRQVSVICVLRLALNIDYFPMFSSTTRLDVCIIKYL